MKNYFYCFLPAGNKEEFPVIDALLTSRKIPSWCSNLALGGQIYKIDGEYLLNLPRDDKGPYLRSEDFEYGSGHSIYPMSDAEELRILFGGTAWISII